MIYWSTSLGRMAGTPSIRQKKVSYWGHDLFCHASWLKIHLQNKFSWSNTDETYQPLRPCDILHAYCFDDQVRSRLLAPWNLTSQHSLILKRDRLHMHHMPTPYLSLKHPYAEPANVLFAVMMSTGCSLCLGGIGHIPVVIPSLAMIFPQAGTTYSSLSSM